MTEKKIGGLMAHNESLNKQITQYLQEALILLIDKKKLQEISITELCKKAGVSRMAFYSNFKTKEELFERIVMYINKDLVDAVGNPFSHATTLSWYVNVFNIMQENAQTIKILLNADRYLYHSTIGTVVLSNKLLSERQKYLRLIWTGGLVNAITFWLDNDMQEDCETVAKLCYESLNNILSCY